MSTIYGMASRLVWQYLNSTTCARLGLSVWQQRQMENIITSSLKFHLQLMTCYITHWKFHGSLWMLRLIHVHCGWCVFKIPIVKAWLVYCFTVEISCCVTIVMKCLSIWFHRLFLCWHQESSIASLSVSISAPHCLVMPSSAHSLGVMLLIKTPSTSTIRLSIWTGCSHHQRNLTGTETGTVPSWTSWNASFATSPEW